MVLHRRRVLAGVAALSLAAACTREMPTAAIPRSVTPVMTSSAGSAIATPIAVESVASSVPAAPPPILDGACADGARFVEDVTIPDGSVFTPGEAFDKRWAVRNDGTCDWGPGYRLVPVGENPFGGAAESALFPARAGATGEWQIDLRAPEQPGEYLGRWRARAPNGALFGDEVYVIILVELPTAIPTPSATATP